MLLEGNNGSGSLSEKNESELPCSEKQEVPADTMVGKSFPLPIPNSKEESFDVREMLHFLCCRHSLCLRNQVPLQ